MAELPFWLIRSLHHFAYIVVGDAEWTIKIFLYFLLMSLDLFDYVDEIVFDLFDEKLFFVVDFESKNSMFFPFLEFFI